jgi:hypothetical protein
MTLGPALLLLSLLDKLQFRPTNPLLIFGRVPLFYFLVHLYVIHFLAIILGSLQYGKFFLVNSLTRDFPPGYGFNLWTVYIIWIGVVGALYPMCLWYSKLKQRRNDWWLSYL